jgi:hypothetical protein
MEVGFSVRVFQFSSSASLEELTGRKADTLDELLELLKTCSSSSIFYHTFSAFRKLREVQTPYTNDFAIWIARSLNEEALAEKLLAIDLAEYNTTESLRSRIVELLEGYKGENPSLFERTATEPFYLYSIVRFVYFTDKFAYNLSSFRQLLDTISIDSLYYHFIESRLQSQLKTDDFSSWMEESPDYKELAEKIRNIDINIYTLEELRVRIGEIIDEYL